ncbi:hypothetical protein ACLMJK_007735 [Lecanora helva]
MSDHSRPSVSPLLRIPLELRFIIYEELLAPFKTERVLCSCLRCQEKKATKTPSNPSKRPKPIFPAILATNSLIHDEAIVILYSKNHFQLICPEITTAPTNKRIPEICGINSLVNISSAIRNSHLKQATLTFSCYARDELDTLPLMWSYLEPMILTSYPNIDRISINLLRVNVPYRVLIVMTRKHFAKDSKARFCADKYFDAIKIRPADSNWEMKLLCDAFLPAQRPGLFGESTFAIRAIQWSDGRKSRNLEKLSRGIVFD